MNSESTDRIIVGSRMDRYTGLLSSRTQAKHTFPVSIKHPDLSKVKRNPRNTVIQSSMLKSFKARWAHEKLSRKQPAKRHGVSSDRITQWLWLLKLSAQKLQEIKALGDSWNGQVITERELRRLRRFQN